MASFIEIRLLSTEISCHVIGVKGRTTEGRPETNMPPPPTVGEGINNLLGPRRTMGRGESSQGRIQNQTKVPGIARRPSASESPDFMAL